MKKKKKRRRHAIKKLLCASSSCYPNSIEQPNTNLDNEYAPQDTRHHYKYTSAKDANKRDLGFYWQ